MKHTDIKNLHMNINNGDNHTNASCCSAWWQPPIKAHPWLTSCIAAWINCGAVLSCNYDVFCLLLFCYCFVITLVITLDLWCSELICLSLVCFIVTIVEIHMLILDVCESKHKSFCAHSIFTIVQIAVGSQTVQSQGYNHQC